MVAAQFITGFYGMSQGDTQNSWLAKVEPLTTESFFDALTDAAENVAPQPTSGAVIVERVVAVTDVRAVAAPQSDATTVVVTYDVTAVYNDQIRDKTTDMRSNLEMRMMSGTWRVAGISEGAS